MKCAIFAVLAFAVALEATPYRRIGSEFGSGIGSDLGLATGIGLGGAAAIGEGALEAAELGTGLLTGVGHGIINGIGSGLGLGGVDREFARGARGNERERQYQRGDEGYHRRGGHNNRLTTITTAEQNESHDDGSHRNFAEGADRGAGYGRYANGRSGYGVIPY